jgi:cell shape-determining protein MreC
MKDWEIRKVNMLYSELDQLRAENAKLRDQGDRLSVLEDKLNQLVEMLQVSDKKVPKIKK